MMYRREMKLMNLTTSIFYIIHTSAASADKIRLLQLRGSSTTSSFVTQTTQENKLATTPKGRGSDSLNQEKEGERGLNPIFSSPSSM